MGIKPISGPKSVSTTDDKADNEQPEDPKEPEKKFDKADKDQDGKLSEDEMKAQGVDPKVADTDGDGKVTKEEYERYMRDRGY